MRTFAAILAVVVGAASAMAGEGTLIVLNKAEASASLISLETGDEVKRVPVGEGPHEVAVSPDGRTAVVADYGAQQGGNTLTVIDIVAGEATATIGLGDNRRPHGIVYLDDTRVIVTTEAARTVLIVDVVEKLVKHVIQTEQNGTHMVAVTPDGARAFTANIGSGSMTAIDLAEMKVIGQIETGRGAEGIDVTPDGKQVWVSNRAENTLTVIDTQTLHVKARLECGDFPIRLKFTPDGSAALVSNARSGEVVRFDTSSREETDRLKLEIPGSGEEMLGSQGPVPIGILVTPDGERAYVASANADVVSVIDLTTWTILEPIRAGRQPDGMAYSPLEVTPVMSPAPSPDG